MIQEEYQNFTYILWYIKNESILIERDLFNTKYKYICSRKKTGKIKYARKLFSSNNKIMKS